MKLSGWLVGLYLNCFLPSVILAMKRIIVNYSSQNLSSVPTDLRSSTEDLDLSLNHIQALSGRDFTETPRLHFLNLSWNILAHIDIDTFKPTPALEVLDLSHNKLQNLSNQLYLLHTGNLKFLDLSSNMFSAMALGREFSTLKHLQWLGLSAEKIQSTGFVNIAHLTLKTVFINTDGTTVYERSSLTAVHAEKAIIVLSNSELDCQIAADAFGSFKGLKFTNVDTEMKFLEALQERASPQTISLEISHVSSTWDILTWCVNTVLMSSIQELSFSDVTITKMAASVDVVPGHVLQSFSTHTASVTTFLFNQEELYDFFINIPARNFSVTHTPIVHMTCPKSVSQMKVLDLSDCALTEKVFSEPGKECSTLTGLEMLVLKGNILRHLRPLTSRIHFMDSLQYVDFSQNKLTYTEEQGRCVWPPKMIHLDLSSNSLDQNVFKCLPPSIRILNLQNNQLTTVPADIPVLDNLSVLDLTANRLLDLPSCQAYPNLHKLLVRSNSLYAPSPGALEACLHLKVLDASHNPFICTCALRDFTALINGRATQRGTEQPAVILGHWPDGYQCSYPEAWHNTRLKDFYLPEISCNAWLLSVTILVPTISLVIAVSLLCHKLDAPWYLKMIWRWTRSKHHAIISQERVEGVCFHAFVSHSQKNAEWVKSQLLPKLEGSGLRVCHHERDFIPGKTIVQNILKCIEQSRRCIFVLSSHFVQSEWCHYELYFANHQKVTRGLDSIILILLEPLPPYLIPAKYYQLKAIMSRRTYLEWPQEAAKQTLFWINLRAALQAELPLPSEGESTVSPHTF